MMSAPDRIHFEEALDAECLEDSSTPRRKLRTCRCRVDDFGFDDVIRVAAGRDGSLAGGQHIAQPVDICSVRQGHDESIRYPVGHHRCRVVPSRPTSGMPHDCRIPIPAACQVHHRRIEHVLVEAAYRVPDGRRLGEHVPIFVGHLTRPKGPTGPTTRGLMASDFRMTGEALRAAGSVHRRGETATALVTFVSSAAKAARKG